MIRNHYLICIKLLFFYALCRVICVCSAASVVSSYCSLNLALYNMVFITAWKDNSFVLADLVLVMEAMFKGIKFFVLKMF